MRKVVLLIALLGVFSLLAVAQGDAESRSVWRVSVPAHR